jgi:phage gp46-like protein
MIRIVPIDTGARAHLAPDIVWNGLTGDVAVNAWPGGDGGLKSDAHLVSAITIALMTDIRVEADELREGDVNRGWPGDAFDLDEAAGERPLGSRLWLLRRRTVSDSLTPVLAEDYAREALQFMLDIGAVAGIEVEAVADPARNRLDLSVVVTDREGVVLVAPKYQVHWA